MPIAAHLATLETSGLSRLAQIEPEIEYLFRHALVQEAAYETILKADRRVLHRVVGEALERLYPDRLTELAPILGQHFAEAGASEKASAIYAFS
jgi:predicted ATPase